MGCPVSTPSVVTIASWKPLSELDLYPLEIDENRGQVSDLDPRNLNVWIYKCMAMGLSWETRRRERNSVYWEIATFLMAGDMCVFHRTEAAWAEKDCQKLFTILFQRTNCKGICDPSENLRKEENKTKERTGNWITERVINKLFIIKEAVVCYGASWRKHPCKLPSRERLKFKHLHGPERTNPSMEIPR